MSFFAVLFALLAEQLKPLSNLNPIHHALAAWVRWAGRNFDAGADVHARGGWAITVLAPASLVAVSYYFIDRYSTELSLIFDVAVLYFTLGFRQFSHHFTDIRDALEAGREDRARELLAHWQNLDASELPRTAMSSACSSGSWRCRPSAWGRLVRCSTDSPNSPAVTGPTAAA